MSDNTLSEYIGIQVMDWNIPLSQEERKTLYRAMYGSVQYMRNKDGKPRHAPACELVTETQGKPKSVAPTDIKPSKIKTHHIYM